MRKHGAFWWWASEKDIQRQRFCFLSCKPGRNKTKASVQEWVPGLGHTTEFYSAYNTGKNSPLTDTSQHIQAWFTPILPHGCTTELKGFVHQSITASNSEWQASAVFHPNVLDICYCYSSLVLSLTIATELMEKEEKVPDEKELPWMTDTFNSKK